MAQVFWRFNTFFWSSEKNDSMAALSADVATCPIDASSSLDSMTVVNFRDRNWVAVSEWTIKPGSISRMATALRNAVAASSAVILVSIE